MRGRRKRRGLALALSLLLLFAGCTGEAPPVEESPTPTAAATPAPEPSVFALGCDMGEPLHPLRGDSQINQEWFPLVYEPLYELDNTFTPQPRLARAASPSEGGAVWSIYLRAGAVFSDGTPVTTHHAASSLLAAKRSPVYGARLAEVTNVEVSETGALVLTLSRPNGSLPALLDVPIVLERGAEEGEGEGEGEEAEPDVPPLGTGAYMLDGGTSPRLLANPRWSGEPPLFREIPLREIHSPDRHISAFSSGEISAVTTDFTAVNALGYSGTYETYDYPTTQMLYVGFNTSRKSLCADAPLRLALSRAMDRGSIVTSMLSGHGLPAAIPLSPQSPWYDGEGAALLDYDMASAAQLLEELGYAAGEDGILTRGRTRLTLTMVVNNDSPVKTNIAHYLARSFSSLGIEAAVSALSWEQYAAALAAGQFDLYLGEIKLTGDFDLTALTEGALNYGDYDNSGMGDLLRQYREAGDGGRAQAASRLFRAMGEDLPFAVLCFKHHSLLVRWGMLSDPDPTRGSPFRAIEG